MLSRSGRSLTENRMTGSVDDSLRNRCQLPRGDDEAVPFTPIEHLLLGLALADLRVTRTPDHVVDGVPGMPVTDGLFTGTQHLDTAAESRCRGPAVQRIGVVQHHRVVGITLAGGRQLLQGLQRLPPRVFDRKGTLTFQSRVGAQPSHSSEVVAVRFREGLYPLSGIFLAEPGAQVVGETDVHRRQPEGRGLAVVLRPVPRPIGLHQEVAGLHELLLAFGGGIDAAALDGEIDGGGRVTMRFRRFPGVEMLNRDPEGSGRSERQDL